MPGQNQRTVLLSASPNASDKLFDEHRESARPETMELVSLAAAAPSACRTCEKCFDLAAKPQETLPPTLNDSSTKGRSDRRSDVASPSPDMDSLLALKRRLPFSSTGTLLDADSCIESISIYACSTQCAKRQFQHDTIRVVYNGVCMKLVVDPIIKHRNLVPLRQTCVDEAHGDTYYDPTFWRLRNGHLHRCKGAAASKIHSFHDVPRKLSMMPTEKIPGSVLGLESRVGLDSNHLNQKVFRSEIKESGPSSKDKWQEKQDNGKESECVIRVGDGYQAIVLDHPYTDSTSTDNVELLCAMIWDPKRADEAIARGADIDGFLNKGRELNVKLRLMGALHHGDYCVRKAHSLFIDMHKSDPYSLVELSTAQEASFIELSRDIIGRDKDFRSAAEIMGCSKEAVMVRYYRWKTKRREYDLLKLERRKESNVCDFCGDGGTLIICANCRKAFHPSCLGQTSQIISRVEWYCKQCVHTSPAKLRRLSGVYGSSSSPHYRLDSQDLESYESTRPISRSLELELVSAERIAALQPIHKEFIHSSMAENDRCRVSALERTIMSSNKTSTGGSSDSDSEVGSNDDELLASPLENEKEDDKSASTATYQDAISVSSDGEYSKDSSFHDEDVINEASIKGCVNTKRAYSELSQSSAVGRSTQGERADINSGPVVATLLHTVGLNNGVNHATGTVTSSQPILFNHQERISMGSRNTHYQRAEIACGTWYPPLSNTHLHPQLRQPVAPPDGASKPTQNQITHTNLSHGVALVPTECYRHSFQIEEPVLCIDLLNLGIPDLFHFLVNRGIATRENFLDASSWALASEWSKERGIPKESALDFIRKAQELIRLYSG